LIFYGITIAALIIIYLHLGEIVRIRDIFLKSNREWLFVIVLLQIFTYYCIAKTYQDVLLIKNLKLSVRELFPITFVVQFLNQALPSATVSGQLFFIHYLRKHNLTTTQGISRAILEMAALYSAFGIMFFVAIGFLIHHPAYVGSSVLHFITYIFIGIVILFSLIFLYIQFSDQHKERKGIMARIEHYFEKRNHTTVHTSVGHVRSIVEQIKDTMRVSALEEHGWIFGRAILWQIGVIIADIVTLYVIGLAIDHPISWSVALIVFTLNQFVAMISFVPGAVGVFEGGMTLMFISFGIPANPALAITLLFRAFTFWLPMPFGWFLYRKYSKKMHT
jgi:uncharacterized protein (TIRG00374 family)